MQLVRSFVIFLLYSSTVCAMKLATVPAATGICQLEDEFITTEICARLDRPSRDALRRTNKKYFKLILSQDMLNRQYSIAYITENKIDQDYWQKRGGWLPHQEFARAIKNQQYPLASWLLAKNKADMWGLYCRNIEEALKTSTVDEMVPVIRWLLNTRKPAIYSSGYLYPESEFFSGYNCARNQIEKYPDVQKIVNVFEAYRRGQEEQERTSHNVSFGGLGPWHARGDYY